VKSITNESGRIHGINCMVATTGETLAVRITIDGGTARTGAQVAVADTAYYALINYGIVHGIAYSGAVSEVYRSNSQFDFLKSCLIEIRKTTANGAGDITSIVNFSLLKERS